MPKAKPTTISAEATNMFILERSRFIVQLRCEIASDMASVFQDASSWLNGVHVNPQREMCRQLAAAFERKSLLLKTALDLGKKS